MTSLKPSEQHVLHVLWSANIFIAFWRVSGIGALISSRCQPENCSGEVLLGKVRHAWADAEAQAKISSLDLKSQNKAVECLRNPLPQSSQWPCVAALEILRGRFLRGRHSAIVASRGELPFLKWCEDPARKTNPCKNCAKNADF